MGTSSGVYELNHDCASQNEYPWLQIFYFDSNTFVPLKCDALVFFVKCMLTGCRLVDCSLA